jgi:predicted O-methyltransferase YrrM
MVHPRSQLARFYRYCRRTVHRLRFAMRYYRGVPSNIVQWALYSHEDTNFTYDITPQNRSYLAATVAIATGIDIDRARAFIAEPDRDVLKYVANKLALLGIKDMDKEPAFGRRLGWYAIARALRPRLIVETGVDRGLGSVLLCAALKRNAEEGFPGRYYGTDLNPAAGALFGEPWSGYGEILYGDSIASLKKLTGPVDLFINDSDHSAEYEYREYQTIKPLLSERAVVLGDNAHVNDMLLRFSEGAGRQFLFFHEQPRAHWYPGAGIGISFPRRPLRSAERESD